MIGAKTMYFPENMTFQYFFFNTYIGYFLQVLIIAVVVGIVYILCNSNKENNNKKLCVKTLFICYFTALLCLTLFQDLIHDIYYFIFYQRLGDEINWFVFEYDLSLDFYKHISTENVVNIFMFCPFGFLYPLSKKEITWKRALIAGVITSIAIEFLQPIVGRSFDINDIVLNSIGVILSTAIFFCFKKFSNKRVVIKHVK